MKQLQILFLASSIIYFSACSDPALDSTESATATGTVADIQAMLSAESPEETFAIDNGGFEIITDYNTIITGGPQTFANLDGSAYNGTVSLDVIELQTKSEIIRYGYQTRASNGEILTSDGEYKFEATGGNRELKLAPGATLDLKIPNQNPSTDALLFDLTENELWNPMDSLAIRIGEWEFGDNDWDFGYVTSLSTLDWVNVDYFTKFDEPLTDISICLPSRYDQENSLAFIVFPDRDIVLSGTINLPIGETAIVVLITADGDDEFSIAKQEIVIEEDLKVNLTPEPATEEEILACLEGLN